MEIYGTIKTSDWGKLGNDSEVAKLAVINNKNFIISPKTSYAEMWFGDHPNGQSKIKQTDEDLGDFIAKDNCSYIGGLKSLPFLLKVLSIQKALSIQVHPNKVEAEILHASRPDIYKDANHKPELAIALTPFRALCGFRPYEEIVRLFNTFKPLLSLVGEENIVQLKDKGEETALKKVFSMLMNANDVAIADCIREISEQHKYDLVENQLDETFNVLKKDFPNDVGILCIFFLNIVNLKEGESIFLEANEPHAYLNGDCIECMACSDNVVRAGLTSKFKDIPTLLAMLNYKASSVQEKLLHPVKLNSYVHRYAPNIKDFALNKICIPSCKNFEMKNEKFGSILLVISGEIILITEKYGFINLSRGKVVFIPGNSGDTLQFRSGKESEEYFVAYQAMYNSTH